MIRTEWDQRWWITKVREVDASRVRLEFQNASRTESIYRGSTRLGPLYLELQRAKKKALVSSGNHMNINMNILSWRLRSYVGFSGG